MGQVASNINHVASNIKTYFSPTKNDETPEIVEGCHSKEKFLGLKRPTLILNNFQGKQRFATNLPGSLFLDSKLSSPSLATPRQAIKRSLPISPIKLPTSILDIFSFSPKRPRLEEEYLDYPFLVDAETIDYINKSKVIFILRGLPGSGKTTIAKAIERKLDSIEVCSADYFFMRDGIYVFDGGKLSEAHNQCQENAIKAVRNQSNLVIDNTNLRLWEMKFYLKLAMEYNYHTLVVEPKTPWKEDASVLAQKNTHNMDEETLQWKCEGFQELEPLYFGWFLNERDASFLDESAHDWLRKLFSLKEFTDDFSWHTGIQTFDCIENWFKKPGGAGKILHCTSKYTGKGKAPGAMDYMEDDNVKNSVGKVFNIEVTGFVITPRTFGARVRLSDEHAPLWAADDEEAVPEVFWSIGSCSAENEASDECQDPLLSSEVVQLDEPMVTEEEASPAVNGIEGNTCVEEESTAPLINGDNSDDSSLREGFNLEESSLTNVVNVEESAEIATQKDLPLENESEQPTESQECAPLDCVRSDELNELDMVNGSSDSPNSIEQAANQAEAALIKSTLQDKALNDIPDEIVIKDQCDSITPTPNGKDTVKGDDTQCIPNEEMLSDASPRLMLESSFSSGKSASPSPIKRPPKKGGVPIPPNDLPLSESISALTCRVVPQDISYCTRYAPTFGAGSRAHVTIAYGLDESPATTGLDLIFAIQNEQLAKKAPSCEVEMGNFDDEPNQTPFTSASNDGVQPQNVSSNWPFRVSIPKGTLIGYGNGLWVIYPEEKILMSGLFTSNQ